MMFDLRPGQRGCSYFQEADEYGMSGSRLRLGESCLGQTGISSQSSQCCLRLLSLSVLDILLSAAPEDLFLPSEPDLILSPDTVQMSLGKSLGPFDSLLYVLYIYLLT